MSWAAAPRRVDRVAQLARVGLSGASPQLSRPPVGRSRWWAASCKRCNGRDSLVAVQLALEEAQASLQDLDLAYDLQKHEFYSDDASSVASSTGDDSLGELRRAMEQQVLRIGGTCTAMRPQAGAGQGAAALGRRLQAASAPLRCPLSAARLVAARTALQVLQLTEQLQGAEGCAAGAGDAPAGAGRGGAAGARPPPGGRHRRLLRRGAQQSRRGGAGGVVVGLQPGRAGGNVPGV